MSTNIILPAPGQGAIALLCRKDDREIIKICKKIDDINTRITINAERALIKKINGNCFTPLAAFAKIKGKKLTIKGTYFQRMENIFHKRK